MATSQPSLSPTRTRYYIGDIKLDPALSKYRTTLEVLVDGKTIHKLSKINAGDQLHWADLCLSVTVLGTSHITIKITHNRIFSNRIKLATWNASEWASKHIVEHRTSDDVYSVQVRLLDQLMENASARAAFKDVQLLSMVMSIAYSPGGHHMALGSQDSMVYVWDIQKHEAVLGPLRGHKAPVWSVAYSPDGRRIASGSQDGTIHVWDAQTGELVLVPLKNHPYGVYCVAYSPDGRQIASGSGDHQVRVSSSQWGQDVPALEPLRGHKHSVESVTYSPDGRHIVSGSWDRTVIVWDAYAGVVVLGPLLGHSDWVRSVAYSPDGRYIASGSLDKTIRVWDAQTGNVVLGLLRSHTGGIWSVAYSPDGRHIASGSGDRTVLVWSAQTGDIVLGPLRGHTGHVESVAYSPDGRYVASASGKTIHVWDTQQNELVQPGPRLEDASLLQGYTGILENAQHAQDLYDASMPGEKVATLRAPLAVRSSTNARDIIAHLTARGCSNLTDHIDASSCGTVPLAQGGFGDIYQAMLHDGTWVAVKTLRVHFHSDDDMTHVPKRAGRELYAWSRCSHRNVLPLLGLAEFQGQIRMVSRWMVNGSMPAYLGAHPESDRCVLSSGVCDGVEYIHSAGVIHGDLKGVNVLVSDDGAPVITDFGNAIIQNGTLQFSTTMGGAQMTPAWTAPELLRQDKIVQSEQADVYALGMTILEIITGKPPYWECPSVFKVIVQITSGQVPPRSAEHIPPTSTQGNTLWALLVHTWAQDPKERPSAQEVANGMREIRPEGLVTLPRPT